VPRKKENRRMITYNKLIEIGKANEKEIMTEI
jgi:hypothetical protein